MSEFFSEKNNLIFFFLENNYFDIKYFFDIWYGFKNLGKKLLKVFVVLYIFIFILVVILINLLIWYWFIIVN